MAEEAPFDLMVRFGPVPPRGVGHKDIDSVRAALERQRITGAVLVGNRAIQFDAPTGNTLVADAINGGAGSPTLVTGAVLDPRLFTGAPTPPAEARMYYVLPATQGFPLPYAPLRAMLQSLPQSLPIYFEVRREGDATQIGMLLQETGYKGACLLGGATGYVLNEAITVAKGNNYVGITTHGMRGVGEIGYAVGALGANRVFFASGSPTESLAAAVAMLKLAGLSPDDRAAIFGANARRLLGIAA
ncbi:MAG: hypothetical protein EOP58_16750 [Sphingomonadales bacterium]|nr:MAG: hypothetical protein EOP58_16750 [Sphingomonadales bacterium]